MTHHETIRSLIAAYVAIGANKALADAGDYEQFTVVEQS